MIGLGKQAIERLRKWRWLLLPPVAAVCLVTFFSIVVDDAFNLKLSDVGLAVDMAASTLLAYWLYALLRPWWVFLLVLSLLMGTLYVANGLKVAFFGFPVKPSDLDALPVLLDQVEGWRFLSMLLPLALLSLLFLAGLRWRWWTPALLVGGVLLVAGATWLMPRPISRALDRHLGYSPYGDIKDFDQRGPLLYLLNEQTRDLARVRPPPTRQEVEAVLHHEGLPQPLPPATLPAKRDVYVFMMETLWDPSVLTAAHFDRDPLAPAYRKLWEEAGESKVMVPVFGSGTPNSEFEALCGVPVSDSRMVFMRVLKAPMMCMPRLLAQLGYTTTSLTADDYGTWNRGDVFQLIGFERFYDKRNLDATDKNGQFISDAQLFQQADEIMSRDAPPAPRLRFISTDSGHYPFDMNGATRPALIHTDSVNPLVRDYANAVYYDSRELADYIARIRARDPQAVIVAFGDHLPVLRDPDIFARSGLLTNSEVSYTAQMFVTHLSTPLLVIDGSRGPLRLGHISLFEVPRLVMSLLGIKQPTELDAFAPPPGLHVRLYHGRATVLSDDGRVQLCVPRSHMDLCVKAAPWIGDMQVLRSDLLGGHHYADDLLLGADPHRFDLPARIPYLVQAPLHDP